jgi:hypothetical protein
LTLLGDKMDIPTVLSSALLAGLVAGLVTLRTTERKIAIENITKQRQLWREKIRDVALRVNTSYINGDTKDLTSQYIEVQLLLNPCDCDDKSILDTILKMIKGAGDSNLNIELSEKLSLLLKHDWERAKLEAKSFRFNIVGLRRISYEKFKENEQPTANN